GGFGDEPPSRRRGPPERSVRKLVDRPARVLLEPVVAPALRAAITQARSSARLVWRVVLEVALCRRPAAPRPGAGRGPDVGQVPEPAPGIGAPGPEPVIALLRDDRVHCELQVRAASGGTQPPGPIPARRPIQAGGGEREFRPVPVPARWSGSRPVAL